MTFSDEILKVDTCRVYHSGPQYFVEIDIVLPPEMPLWRAHDIAQDLQDQIEALPDVDRCFVHVDHEVSHKPVSGSCASQASWLIKQEHRKKE
jgi:divalent metal cation (Fe/Co/Zn/Cd) transporter